MRKKLTFTTRYVLVFGLLMMIANTILGLVILHQSESAMKALINKNMLDVVETAAALLDGDTLGALTEEDVGGKVFRDIAGRLIVFQNHEDVAYIYAVRQVDDEKYIFTVDPDPVEPGAFGEEVVITNALVQAGKGIPTVDSETMEDRWGNYYSAYCPVYDSAGRVAGIVGIDFDAAWYDAKIWQHTISIAIITLLSVLTCGIIVFTIAHNVRKRFKGLHSELSRLSSGMDQLVISAGGVSDSSVFDESESSEDEIEKLSRKIQLLQKDMAVYERLQRDQYYRDVITGIPNLVFMKQFADEKMDQLRSEQVTPAMIYFDIRSMVSYNTEYGYSKGDELLKLTANTILDAFPKAMVGRGEGDHFIVIDGYDDTIMQKALQVNDKIKHEAFGQTTGIQCAVVELQPDMRAVDGIQCARNTLKKIGDDLNIVCRLYSREEDSAYLTSSYIVQHFDEALRDSWVKVFYQPIVRSSTKKVSTLEALARWIDPVQGVISPGTFIPVLSRYHLLHKLDLYMVEQICKEFRVREEAGMSMIPVSVNFSAQDFDYIDVPEALNALLEKYRLPRSCIIIEITEQDLAKATDHFMEQLRRIHESGYSLWLDDFGSGYSSLNVFSQYHVDRIKFDMDLVRHLDDNNGANRIIMKTIVNMCRQMGIHTLAEGIETEEQFQFLKEIDCELVQGFYFFRPEPVEAALTVIRDSGQMPEETLEERRKMSDAWIAKGRDAEG